MRGLAPKSLAFLAALAALLLLAAPALATPHFDGIFKVGGNGANNIKMVSGPDGNVWMTLEGTTKDVAKISPAGVVTEYDLEEVEKPGGIAVGPEGNLWVTIEKGVARFSPADPEATVETFEVANAIKGFSPLVAGPGGEMWVATKDTIIHFPASSPLTSKSEFGGINLTPHDIDVAGSRIVIADGGNGRIVVVPSGGVPEDVHFVNNPMGTSQGVAGNPNGQFAFSESDGKEGLGLDTPPSPATAELLGAGDPFGVALGSDGAYYFAMSGDDNVRRLAPGSPSTVINGAFPKGARPRQVTAGPGNTIWVAVEGSMGEPVEVVRISGLEPPSTKTNPPPGPTPAPLPPVALPQTLIGKKPKKVVTTTGQTAKVKFSFSSDTAGARFACSLGRKVKPKGRKARFVGQAFHGCKSPKSYTLKPGAYRFQVRAVSGSLLDPTPASFGFKVVRSPR